ncbi:MAG: NAD-dependent DNA ligase LigA [Planctomycetota bacterium]
MTLASKSDAARAAALQADLLRYDRLYYLEGQSAISDADYDALMRELVALETAHPDLVTPDSPTQRVGAPLAEGEGSEKVRHAVPMLSIDSLFSAEEVRDFEASVRRYLGLDEAAELRWFVEPKFDGVSISLTYEDGRLVRAVTRGDGAVGEDVTRNVRTVRNVRKGLDGSRRPVPRLLEVRGELLISRAAFERFNERRVAAGEPRLANPRNATAGAVRRNDPGEVNKYPLEFHLYAVARCEGAGPFETQAEQYAACREWGLQDSGYGREVDGIDGALAYHADMEAKRADLPFEVDGVVAKLARLDLRARLGERSRSTRWQYAQKFAAVEQVTTLRAIEVQVGVNGRLTPRAHVDPVQVLGVTVRHATLHNESYVAELGARIGDRVFVKRAGDVIPQITGVALHPTDPAPEDWEARVPESLRGADGAVRPAVAWRFGAEFTMPEVCPACGTAVVREGKDGKDGKYLRCPNVYGCRPQLIGRTIHMAGRGGFEIDSLGESMIVQLYDAGLLREPTDLFHLTEAQREQLVALERWGEKSVDNLLAQLAERRAAPLARILAALSIPEVGASTARLLAKGFDLPALRVATVEDLCHLDGIGETVAERIHSWFQDPRNVAQLDHLLAGGVHVLAEEEAAGGAFADKTVVFTGTLESVTRAEAKKLVERQGGRVASSVSAKTHFLVQGGKPGSKAKAAEALGVSVLSEADFRARLGLPALATE